MTREVVPSACHHTETLFRYLRKRTPKVLIKPTFGLVWVEGINWRYTLGEKNHSVDPDRLVRVRFVVRTDSSRSRDKGGACEAKKRDEVSVEDIYIYTYNP